MYRIVNCPQCGNDSIFGEENPSRPFCSKRCKMIDLGTWADEGYRVPSVSQDSPPEEYNEDSAPDSGGHTTKNQTSQA